MATGKGVITGDQVFKGVLERAKEINEEMKELVANFKKLEAATKNSKSVKAAYAAEKQLIQLQKESQRVEAEKIKVLTQKKKLEEQAAKTLERQAKAQKAVNQAEKSSSGPRSTNLSQLKSLNNAYNQQSRYLNEIRNRYKALAARKAEGAKLSRQETKEMKRLRKEVTNLDRRLKKIDASVGQFQRNVGNYGSALRSLFSGFRSILGAFGITSGLLVAVNLFRDAVRVVKQFDQAQADLAAVLGKSKKEIGLLSVQAKQLGATTAFTAIQVSQLQLELSKLGFNQEEILNATLAVENLAIATGVEASRAALLAGAALRGFQLDAIEADRVASALAVSTVRSASSFQSLEIALPKVAALGAGLNFELEDVVATLGVLKNAGFEASITGTSLRQVFAELAKDGSELNEALGGNVESFDDFLAGLRKLNARGSSLQDILKLVEVRAGAALKVLTESADDVDELRKDITDVNAELQNIADTKLDSIEGDIRLLTSAWEGFIQSVEDGTGPLSEATRGFLEGITSILNALTEYNKGFAQAGDEGRIQGTKIAIEAVRQEAEKYNITLKEAAEKLIPQYTKIVKEKRKVLQDELLQAGSDSYADQIENFFSLQNMDLNEANKGFEKFKAVLEGIENIKNTGVLPSVDPNEGQVEETIETLESLKKKLKELTEYRDQKVDVNSPLFVQYTEEIEQLRERIKKLQEILSAPEEGTLAWYDYNIKLLKEQQDEVAKTSKEYQDLQNQINEYNAQAEVFRLQGGKVETEDTGRFATVNDDNPDGTSFSFNVGEQLQGSGGTAEELLKAGAEERMRILEEEWEREKKIREQRQKFIEDQEQALRDAVLDTFNSFAEYYGIDMKNFEGLMDGKKNSIDDWKNAIQEATQFLTESIINNYAVQIEEARTAMEAITSSTEASEEQKKIAREKFQKEESKLREKQYKTEQQALVFQVTIDTAAQVAKILTQAAVLSSNPFTMAFAPNAYAQAAIAAAVGAAQIGMILAQPIPKFFKGKKAGDSFEGLATWGEHRREVLIDESGNAFISPGKTTPLFVRQSDIIAPSIPKFYKDVKDPGTEIHKRVIGKMHQDTQEREKSFSIENRFDLKQLKGFLTEEIRRGFAKSQINIHNKFPDLDRFDMY